MMVKLDTNGFLLDEAMVKKLKDSGLDFIGVSIDSSFEAVHDKLRGVIGIFKRAITGIKYCKKYNLECYISTYATKENLKNGDLEKLMKLAKKLGVKIRILSSIRSGKLFNRKDLVLSPEEITLLRNLLEKNMVYWETDDLDDKEIPFFCNALEKNFFYISAHGDVQPCCYLPIIFGNIRKEPLESIVRRMWDSDMFVNYKECSDCPVNNEDFRDKYFY